MHLTRTATTLALNVNVDWVREITTEFLGFFLCEGVTGNYFEGLLDVDSFLGTRLEVWNAAFGLAESHGALRGDLQLLVFPLTASLCLRF